MDMKALAKSKRAHSLNHSKKHHPHQESKAPSISSVDKKPTGKQAKERPPQSHGSKPLPSNCDRYDADLDLGFEDAALASSSQPTEFVVPKSKGADYAYLLSEAKAQSQEKYSSNMFPLFNDVIHDFTQDFGPMLVAKGRSMLSWIADDDFVVEGKASIGHEAHFLSLNLNALAEQLAKAKLSERLFLEPEILRPELLDDDLQPCGEDKHDSETCTSAVTIDSGLSSLGYNQEGNKNVQQYYESASASIAMPRKIPVQTSEERLMPIKQIKDEILQSQATDRSISPNPILKHVDSVSENRPIFEAASAEAELDMLLNSFCENKVVESSSASSTGIPSIAADSAETVKKGTLMMKNAAEIDDIDKLLEETPNLTKVDVGQLSHGAKVSPGDTSSPLQPSSESKLLDDFDSWLDTI